MGSSGGMSQSEIYNIQKQAREDAERQAEEARQKANAEAQKAADNGAGKNVGGEGSEDGALVAGKKKRGSTLSGEGESTFSPATSKLGE